MSTNYNNFWGANIEIGGLLKIGLWLVFEVLVATRDSSYLDLERAGCKARD